MKASLEVLDKWIRWMDEETAYAHLKFPTDQQLEYFRQGVDRGDYSNCASAVGRLLGAANRQEVADSSQVKLRIVLEVGKSAQNHLAVAAIACVADGREADFMPAYYNVQSEWYDVAAQGEFTDFSVDMDLVRRQADNFAILQELQDTGSTEAFDTYLREMSLPLHLGFISLAEKDGWPRPGVSSSLDVVPW